MTREPAGPNRRNALMSRIPMPGILAAALVLLSGSALAQAPSSTPAPTTEKPITQRDPSAVDVIATPATDLNLRKGEIPPILIQASTNPYGLSGMRRCGDLAAEVTRLDAVLGEDIDIAQTPSRKVSAGKVAQSVVGSFIPFRGLIRQISGASEQERRLQLAIYAGSARRSFLKGIGYQRGCAWPARSATPEMLARVAAQNEARARTAEPGKSQPRR